MPLPPFLLAAADDAAGGGSGGEVDPRAALLDHPFPTVPGSVPILPLRHLVLFPGVVAPLTIGRASSRKMLEESLTQSKVIGLFSQVDPRQDEPTIEGLRPIGVAAYVLKFVRQDDGNVAIVVSVLERIARRQGLPGAGGLRAEVEVLHSTPPSDDDKSWQATVQQLRDSAFELIRLTSEAEDTAGNLVMSLQDPGRLADLLANGLNFDLEQKQHLLEELDVAKRVRTVLGLISAKLEIARLQQKIQKDVAAQFTDAQRRAYLQEQLRTIQKELGQNEEGGGAQQAEALRQRLLAAGLPAEVMAQAERELKRLGHVHQASPEFSLIVTYLETLAELPWDKLTPDNLDLDRAQEILDRDHFGLAKVKRRLIEYLAVRKLNPNGQGPILCFLGPPGVGKTSLGQSIADALGRKFVRVSLGGVRDEAEIRGHRRTYVGAMPGRFIQELRRAGSRNPVMMLDEIDKIGADYRGDPASALLEALDPRQNHAFVDHYLGVPFDFSQIIFVGTANQMDPIPGPLRDRMEVIELPGYSDKEKLEICRRYIVPRQLKENGLSAEQCRFETDGIESLINEYTREAGVRSLERQVAAVCRSVGAQVARGQTKPVTVTQAVVHSILGAPRFVRESELKPARPGFVNGLAWTPVGGEILTIEAIRYPGKGAILLTGQIREVMKESAQAALSLVKSRAADLGIPPDAFRDTDLHIHVPAGAVPKDGPSAGAAMFTAIASLFSDRTVRADLAMTGEISLRGQVMPIGGLKEKILAAERAGVTTVVIPKMNEKDLADVPAEVKAKLEIVPVESVDQVLALALVPLKPAKKSK